MIYTKMLMNLWDSSAARHVSMHDRFVNCNANLFICNKLVYNTRRDAIIAPLRPRVAECRYYNMLFLTLLVVDSGVMIYLAGEVQFYCWGDQLSIS